jgi:hypothetical protein
MTSESKPAPGQPVFNKGGEIFTDSNRPADITRSSKGETSNFVGASRPKDRQLAAEGAMVEDRPELDSMRSLRIIAKRI